MNDLPFDVRYAFAQLGLEDEASFEDIQSILEGTLHYRYRTRSRIDQVKKFTSFLTVRAEFGSLDKSFVDIRRVYHRMAMELHPDLNQGRQEAGERLKVVNAHFELIEKINREAKEYYKQGQNVRQEIEQESKRMRQAEQSSLRPQKNKESAFDRRRNQEAGPRTEPSENKRPSAKAGEPRSLRGRTYMAASVPRAVRQSRLGYLPLNCVIGTKYIRGNDGQNFIFDIIMLPARDFQKMRMYIGLQHIVTPELTMGGSYQSSFAIGDARAVTVEPGEGDPADIAGKYFKAMFGVEE